MEAASDALRVELFKWNISVSLIVAGSMDTRMWGKRSHSPVNLSTQQAQLYGSMVKGMEGILMETKSHLLSTRYSTSAIHHALFSRFPCTRYHVGVDAKLTWWMKWLMNDRLLDWGYTVWLSAFSDAPEKRVKFDKKQ